MKKANATELAQFKAELCQALAPAPSNKIVESLFEYEVPVKASEIWPYLIDTSRMNRDLGFPPREEKEVDGENHISTTTLGKKELWIEKPWIWVHENEVQNHRVFLHGWMIEQRGVFRIVNATEDKCTVQVYFRWAFDKLFNYLLFKFVPAALAKSFDKFFQDKSAEILAERTKSELPPAELPDPNSAYELLRSYLQTADVLEIDRIHPKKMSNRLGIGINEVITNCVRMVKDGDMSLSWDIVCPHCRGVRSVNPYLSELEELNNCGPCGINFDLQGEKTVEVVFHLTRKFREVQKLSYCAAEPARKKHIKLVQFLEANEKGTYPLHLTAGSYRLRKKNGPELLVLNVSSNGSDSVEWDGKKNNSVSVREDFTLRIHNDSAVREMFTMEENWWADESLIAGEALTHPAIREIFSDDHLQIGLKINVGPQVILFTDIVGSTPFYKNLGDAQALKVVQLHYKEVTAIINRHSGVVVKFIGDAIMAAFLDIEDAMKCTIEIHQTINGNHKDIPIKLRASFHQGNVLCANLNVGIDYFGNTVNKAAKIQKYADALEIAVTAEDWERLSKQFPQVKVKNSVRDEKLAVDIKVLAVVN